MKQINKRRKKKMESEQQTEKVKKFSDSFCVQQKNFSIDTPDVELRSKMQFFVFFFGHRNLQFFISDLAANFFWRSFLCVASTSTLMNVNLLSFFPLPMATKSNLSILNSRRAVFVVRNTWRRRQKSAKIGVRMFIYDESICWQCQHV